MSILMTNEDFSIIPIAKVHGDTRRTLYEADMPLGEINRERVFAAAKGGSIGPAYHEKFFETFIIPNATPIELTTQPVNAAGEPQGEKQMQTITRPSIIRMPPRIAHHLKFLAETTIVCLGAHPFDLAEHVHTPWLVKD